MFARAFCKHGVPALSVQEPSYQAVLGHPAIPPESLQRLERLQGSYPQNPDYACELVTVYEAFCEADMLAAYRWTRLFFGGLTVSDFSRLGSGVFEAECALPLSVQEIGPLVLPQGIRIFRAVHDLITRLSGHGWEVLIVTASPEILIRSVIHYWQLPVERVLGMQLAVDGDIILPHIIEPMTSRQGKVERLQRAGYAKIDLAMGDSQNDFEMLSRAGLKIFLDRGKKALTLQARQMGALIQPFFKP